MTEVPEPRVTVIPPITRAQQEKLMGKQGMLPKRARSKLGVEAVRAPQTHADGTKRRRRKSKRVRDAEKAKEDARFAFVPTSERRRKIH